MSADTISPVTAALRLHDGDRLAFILESVEGGERWARYSFIGTGARAVFSARGSEVEWAEGDRIERRSVTGDPLEVLREKLAWDIDGNVQE